jgi:hypothetical protein
MVPQKRYKPHTSSDRRRYVEEVDLDPSIHFYMQKPDESGVPLRDALHGRFARLVGRDEPMFKERGPSISVRINVSFTPHGFAVSCTCQHTNGDAVQNSGQVINRGGIRSLLANLVGLSHVRNSRRTWQNLSLALSR